MIDRYHLRYFMAVVDTGNFSRAAAACNVSQPTLSVGIAKLETSLGRTLFHRTNRRVELTDAGARLLAHARLIEAEFAAAERQIVGTAPARTLRLGVLATIAGRWIEKVLHEHRSYRTGVRLELVEGRERDLGSRLARGRLDAALLVVRDTDRPAMCRPVLTEGYSLALAAAHPLASREAIRAEELADDPMILRRHCELLPETSRFFTARGIRPFFPARTTSDDKALAYVRAGLGVTVMPDSFREPGVARVRLEGFDFTREVGLVFAPHCEAQVVADSRILDALLAAAAATGGDWLH